MRSSSIRKFNVLFLALAVWFSAVAFYPVSVAAQTTSGKKQSDKDKKSEKDKKMEKTPSTQTQATNKKTFSTN